MPNTASTQCLGFIAACTLLVGGNAHAALIGDTVNASLQGGSGFGVPTPFSPTSVVVGSSTEFSGTLNAFGDLVDVTLDFDNTGFTVTFLSTGSTSLLDGGGINVSSVDWPNAPGAITGIDADPGNPNGITFHSLTNNSYFISVGTVGGPVVLNANVPSVHQFTFVPEPSSLALLGLGGLLVARRRRPLRTNAC